MVGSLWTGISGLSTHQAALDNESHNIANVNTIGYKSSRISFADQMYQDSIGKGSKVLNAEKVYTQGGMKNTGVSYDVALEGSGFFAVKDPNATGSAEEFYTRAGNFRMGESGNLQDSNQYDVIGWGIVPIDVNEDVTTTNSNISSFTNDYVKVAANQIIKHDDKIETITGKFTDYISTSKSDEKNVMSGLGYKSQSTKIADVEALITDYQNKLKNYANDPAANSSPSIAQVSAISLPDDDTSRLTTESDQIYIYVDGKKYSQNYIETTASGVTSTTDLNGDAVIDATDHDIMASRIETYKALADQISKVTGLTAYIADESASVSSPTTSTWERKEGALASSADTIDSNPMIVIESLIPGEEFVVGDVAEYIASDASLVPGTSVTVSQAVKGMGLGAVESSKEALVKAGAGYQRDIWAPEDLSSLNAYGDQATFSLANPADTNNPFTLTFSVDGATQYDTDGDSVVDALMTPSNKVDAMVNAINANIDMKEYVKAYNYNGNLVIEPIEEGETFVASMTTSSTPSSVTTSSTTLAAAGTIDVTLPATLASDQRLEVTFTVSGTTYTAVAQEGETAWQVTDDGGTTWAAGASAVAALTADNMEDAIATILDDYTGDTTVQSGAVAGGTAKLENDVGAAGTIPAVTSLSINILAESTTETNKNKNTTYSINSGADAEFLEMVNTLDQTASRDSLQLRLDNLGISDSAFGDFNIDSTGLITMTQDGATFAVGQASIAMFNNERGLVAEGNNLMSKTNDSGNAIYNINNDKAAKIAGKTLELSTADLSESLVNLMVFQRAFEANSKSITTSDQILTTLIQLKK